MPKDVRPENQLCSFLNLPVYSTSHPQCTGLSQLLSTLRSERAATKAFRPNTECPRVATHLPNTGLVRDDQRNVPCGIPQLRCILGQVSIVEKDNSDTRARAVFSARKRNAVKHA